MIGGYVHAGGHALGTAPGLMLAGVRGILRGFGLKVGATTRRTYAGRIRELIAGHSTLEAIGTALLKVRDALVHEFAGFERKLRAIARQDENAQRLMTTPALASRWR